MNQTTEEIQISYRPPSSRSSWAAFGVVLLGVLVSVLAGPEAGAWTLAAGCLVGAVARVFIPENAPLAVRRRFIDVSTLLGFAAALAFLAATTTLG